PEQITYYFRRVMVVANGKVPGMAVWRERLFAAMHLNANLPAAYFGVPPAQVGEVGLEVEMRDQAGGLRSLPSPELPSGADRPLALQKSRRTPAATRVKSN